MENKSTKELLNIIRNNQMALGASLFCTLSDEQVDKLYDGIYEAEKIILSRVENNT